MLQFESTPGPRWDTVSVRDGQDVSLDTIMSTGVMNVPLIVSKATYPLSNLRPRFSIFTKTHLQSLINYMNHIQVLQFTTWTFDLSSCWKSWTLFEQHFCTFYLWFPDFFLFINAWQRKADKAILLLLSSN